MAINALGYDPANLEEKILQTQSHHLLVNFLRKKFGRIGNMDSKQRVQMIALIRDNTNRKLSTIPESVSQILAAITNIFETFQNKNNFLNQLFQEKTMWMNEGLISALISIVFNLKSSRNFHEETRIVINLLKLLLADFYPASEELYYLLSRKYFKFNEFHSRRQLYAFLYIISEIVCISNFAHEFLQKCGVSRLIELFCKYSSNATSPSNTELDSNAPNSDVQYYYAGDGDSKYSNQKIHIPVDLLLRKTFLIDNCLLNFSPVRLLSPLQDWMGMEEMSLTNELHGSGKELHSNKLVVPAKMKNNFRYNLSVILPKEVYTKVEGSSESHAVYQVPMLALDGLVGKQSNFDENDKYREMQKETKLKFTTSYASRIERVVDLANKIGHMIVAADLKGMMIYTNLVFSKTISSMEQKPKSPIESRIVKKFILSSENLNYHIRCQILKSLSVLTRSTIYSQFAMSPVNLVYHEIIKTIGISSSRSGDDENNESYLKSLFDVLQSNADAVEALYSQKWWYTQLGNNFDAKNIFNKRRKLDIFIWRIKSEFYSCFECEDWELLYLNLCALGSYLKYCSSRVMASQVVDACMSSLLFVKRYLLRSKLNSCNITHLKLLGALLNIMNLLAVQSRNDQLNDMLLTIWAYRKSNWKYVKSYAALLLMDEKFEAQMQQQKKNSDLLYQMRIQIIDHYDTVLRLTVMHYKLKSTVDAMLSEDEYKRELFDKLDFIIQTPSILQKYLCTGSHTYHFELKLKILKFLRHFFRYSTRSKIKLNIDSYIPFHYLEFLKLYSNYMSDDKALILACAHLNVLKTLALHRCKQVMLKFEQLQVVDFLTREINLEYDITVRAQKNVKKKLPEGNSTMEQSNVAKAVVLKNSTEKIKFQISRHFTKKLYATNEDNSNAPDKTIKHDKRFSPFEANEFEHNSKSLKTHPQKSQSARELKEFGKSLRKSLSLKNVESSEDSLNFEEKSQPNLKNQRIKKSELKLDFSSLNSNIYSQLSNERRESSVDESNLASNLLKNCKKSKNFFKLQVLLNEYQSEEAKTGFLMKRSELDGLKDDDEKYNVEREERSMYASPKLHEMVLKLLLILLLSRDGCTLNSRYVEQYPESSKKMNIPYILWMHLNHPKNSYVLGSLCSSTFEMRHSVLRLLRLSCSRLFQSDLYTDLEWMCEGAYGSVYSAKFLGSKVAVKLIELPSNFSDRCVLYDIFTEVLIMDLWNADSRICHMIDYGVDDRNYWIVMRKYQTNLKDWRSRQRRTLHECLPLYLNVYLDVLEKCQFLSQNKVNHYDIKCENFLIDPIDPNATLDDLYERSGRTESDSAVDDDPFVHHFQICLADFGESLVYSNDNYGYTMYNRGTEFIKSPEMLMSALFDFTDSHRYKRKKRFGSGCQSDVWSLGCLLYELITGEFMFYNTDWMSFWVLITSSNQELVSDEHRERLMHMEPLISFLKWVLVRDAKYRPTIDQMIQYFIKTRLECLAEWDARNAKNEQKIITISSFLNEWQSPRNLTNRSALEYASCRRKFVTNNTIASKTSWISVDQSNAQYEHADGVNRNTQILANFEAYYPWEHANFERPSQILKTCWLGYYSALDNLVLLKNKYNITHILNCTSLPNKYTAHFAYLVVNSNVDSRTDTQLFSRVVSFYKHSVNDGGSMLVVCKPKIGSAGLEQSPSTLLASSLVVAIVMQSENTNFLGALRYAFIRRYIIRISLGYALQLRDYNLMLIAKLRQNSQELCSCICGKNFIMIIKNSNNTKKLFCNCLQNQISNCPIVGCSAFSNQLGRDTGIKWTFVYMRELILWDLRHAVEFNSMEKLPLWQQKTVRNKDWTTYKCTSCQFITHAIHKIEEAYWAIVENNRAFCTISDALNKSSTGTFGI